MKAMTAGEIERIMADLVPGAASVAPAKVLARTTGLTERHVRALRQREHLPGCAAFLALAQHAPELKAAVARLLGFMPPNVQDANETIAELRRLVASLPDYSADGGQPD